MSRLRSESGFVSCAGVNLMDMYSVNSAHTLAGLFTSGLPYRRNDQRQLRLQKCPAESQRSCTKVTSASHMKHHVCAH